LLNSAVHHRFSMSSVTACLMVLICVINFTWEEIVNSQPRSVVNNGMAASPDFRDTHSATLISDNAKSRCFTILDEVKLRKIKMLSVVLIFY
jgi:hypothetical protein